MAFSNRLDEDLYEKTRTRTSIEKITLGTEKQSPSIPIYFPVLSEESFEILEREKEMRS